MRTSVIATLGPLRSLMLLAAAAASVGAFFAHGGEYDPMSWAIVPNAIAPTVAGTLLFLMPLEMLMTRVFMSEMEGAARGRLQRILRIEAVAYVVLLATWVPFVWSLLTSA